mgnify:CR=1 FL=1
MCIVCQSYITRTITKKIHQIQIWQIEDATEEIQDKMKQIWFLVTLCTLLSTAGSLVLFISYIVPTPEDNDVIWIFKLVKVYFPQWESLIMICFLKPTFFVLSYMSQHSQFITIMDISVYKNLCLYITCKVLTQT